ncbi:hypothetical protein [Desulfoluna spongiiphila]|uniref:hypothetical protein n=1 Tax=Desulfoluna spongiiphila TaxID=419481 RepID=UPI001252C339|nr:hypothetical protein [Desulfoluna spongiiphila]VVS94722.1 hypothetical protein DBB_42940 [Desulfoluna spongiiphila]
MESQKLTGIAIRLLALFYAVKAFFAIPGVVGNYFMSRDALRMLPGDEAFAMAARMSAFAQLNAFLPFVMLLFSGVLLAKADTLARLFNPMPFELPSAPEMTPTALVTGALCLLGIVGIGFSFHYLVAFGSTFAVYGAQVTLLETSAKIRLWSGCVTGVLYLVCGVGLLRYAGGIARRFFPVGA